MSLKKRWFRVVLSLLIGLILKEMVRVKTGTESEGLMVITTIVLYTVLSIAVYFYNIYSIQKRVDRDQYINDDLVDDMK